MNCDICAIDLKETPATHLAVNLIYPHSVINPDPMNMTLNLCDEHWQIAHDREEVILL